MVVPTIHGLTVNGIDNSGKNRVVEAFAASRPGTQVPDWAGAVATHPELMQADDLHPIAAGADYRARLIARGIKTCLGDRHRAGRPNRRSSPGPTCPRRASWPGARPSSLDSIIGRALQLFADLAGRRCLNR